MAAYDGEGLTVGELWRCHTEEHRLAEEGQRSDGAVGSLVKMLGHTVGIAIEVTRQGQVAPVVGKEVVLR